MKDLENDLNLLFSKYVNNPNQEFLNWDCKSICPSIPINTRLALGRNGFTFQDVEEAVVL